ncbi:HutD/Ves family protein [Marinobacterium lutimaris]|uniref:HutD protein n=1 Tax=Marinobacterium lutimaris TaxID=568106 RepID=A0A1H5TWM5_9GAMM|nr:HutD family protein [Marinobacterium lutimaris]SEF66431.1 hypothetical protein SAMN05444390_101174 [Marinobacterium lutimaris]
MASYRLLSAAHYNPMPWKNGAGSTLEIACDSDSGLESFGWRLSIADVAESGPFSTFNDYQRVITVLEGQGMKLTVDGEQSRPLTRLDAFAFDGASQVACELVDGPIQDFNLIYAPQQYAARLQWLKPIEEIKLFSSADLVMVFAADEGISLSWNAQKAIPLGRHDCLLLEAGGTLTELVLSGKGSACCLIELSRKG